MQDVPITGPRGGKSIAHGGDLGVVRRRHPDAPLPWIDLSTGINPIAYPVTDLPATAWTRLPARDDERALLDAAARRYRCLAGRIVAAPGTQALIQILPRLVTRSRVAILGPTYAEHEACWRRHGHAVSIVRALADARDADVVVAVNLDNPTGRLLSPQALRDVSTRLLVVDEAFIDLLPAEASLADDPPDNAVILRSFGKTYGLAGLRLGFAVSARPLVDRLHEELGPWSVSGPALAIGKKALADDEWLQQTATRLAAIAERLDAMLIAAGLSLVGGTPLFRLASHLEAQQLADRLARHGIHVRTFDHDPTWLRFGLPAGDEEFSRLSAALQQSNQSS